MCKEKIRVSAASSIPALEIKHEGAAEAMDTAVDSLSPKASCLEKIRVLETNEVGTLKKGSRISGENLENGVDVISSGTPCLEISRDLKDPDIAHLKLANGKGLGPVTLILDGENMELSSSFDQTEDEDLALGCQTPTESIFDPFAPGPEDLAFAPAPKKKMLKGTRVPFRRQLNFELCCDSMDDIETDSWEDAEEEDRLLELICKSFLDLIVSNQLGEMSAENSLAESGSSEGFKTPTSLPLLTGIAETCPGAPRRSTLKETCPGAPTRPTLKSRRLSEGICRKLEF